jgi:hypothetical protein
VLLWHHRRRPEGFPFVHTALPLANGLTLVGFLVYATAPPRLTGVGIVATGNHFFLDAAADALVAGSPPRSRPS